MWNETKEFSLNWLADQPGSSVVVIEVHDAEEVGHPQSASRARQTHHQAGTRESDEAERELEKVDLKLQGINQMRSPTPQSVDGQVARLINDATDMGNLCQSACCGQRSPVQCRHLCLAGPRTCGPRSSLALCSVCVVDAVGLTILTTSWSTPYMGWCSSLTEEVDARLHS